MSALALALLAVLKLADPAESFLGPLVDWATALELLLALMILVPRTARLGSVGLLLMVLAYSLFVVFFGLRDLPLAECGCFGSAIRASFGVHLIVLAALGLLAVLSLQPATLSVNESPRGEEHR